jgi:hypothetical protein
MFDLQLCGGYTINLIQWRLIVPAAAYTNFSGAGDKKECGSRTPLEEEEEKK